MILVRLVAFPVIVAIFVPLMVVLAILGGLTWVITGDAQVVRLSWPNW